MEREKFEELVAQALDEIPRAFKDLLRNVAVIIEARPPRGRRILGLYQGVPFQYRGPDYGNVVPDVIVIYQEPIERICSTEDEIRDEVRLTVLHEVGHYFGLGEKELRDIEVAMRKTQSKGD
ncbi:MAG: metallopeptidase family protein [Candidatus Aminicenantales bacterium]